MRVRMTTDPLLFRMITMIANILKNNGSVVNIVSPRKISVHEDGRMTETCSTVK
jgi:hypothetical protein